nr:mycothione reductase [Propionibacterium sp.]
MSHFDLCVIGSGSGNSLIDDRLGGWSVALVDDGPTFGGTCLNRGCIPTKMFVYPAELCRTPEAAARVNVTAARPVVDFAGLRDRIFGRLDPISAAGEAWRAEASHVTLYRQTGRFIAPRTLELADGTVLTADRFVLAAGSRPVVPAIAGLDAPGAAERVHTSDTIMRIDDLPERLIILGGGFIAAEFAHVFSAFGTDVTIVNRSGRLLRREDEEISRRYTAQARRDLRVLLDAVIERVRPVEGGLAVDVRGPGGVQTLDADLLLIAAGRRPNGDRLDVAAAGVATDEGGFVVVDEFQRTTAEGVWALGDVCSRWQLKHVANHEARVVAHNLLHPDAPVAADHRFVPHAVYAHPTIAAVGLTEAQAIERGLEVAVAVQEYATVAYGWAMADEGHCVKLVADRATRTLVGAHIIGPHADLLSQPLIQAMSTGLDVATMARGQYWIHPALTEVVENALLALDLDATPRRSGLDA